MLSRLFLLIITVIAQGFSTFGQEEADSLSPPFVAEPCSPGQSVLDPITHKFRSNCGPRQWCKPTTTFDRDPLLGLPTATVPIKRDEILSATTTTSTLQSVILSASTLSSSSAISTSTFAPPDFGLCVDKQCRRDEFPFGYKGVPFDTLPRQCSADQYCPDDESQCEPLLPLGLPCLLNRDDSCENKQQLNNNTTLFQVLCLQGLCRLADAGLDEVCIVDSTSYIGYNETGHQVLATFTRDDCQKGLYCQETTSRCQKEKSIGSTCQENRECLDFYCNNQTCQRAPETLRRIPIWAWILIGFIILTSLIIIVFSLYGIHLRHRANRSEELDQFFSQQWQYRNSILSMHAAAAMATTSKQSRLSDASSLLPHKEKRKDEYQDGKGDSDQAWTSGLDLKTSPTSSLRHSSHSLRPE